MIKVKCSQCGKEFEISNNRFASARCRNSKIFCSKKCRLTNQHAYRHISRQCKECGKNFYPKEQSSKFCSLSCAAKYNNKNRTHRDESKSKISQSLKKWNSVNRQTQEHNDKEIELTCQRCGKKFLSPNKNKKFCSQECRLIAFTNGGRIGGLKSVERQAQTKRSKNEILFASLCKEIFPDTICNVSMFNGWDADVIIPSKRTAVLWNGKWHYEKIKKNHSVEQVQNRDNIKITEIENAGYTPYIVKDMGKYNEKFVLEEFEKFRTALK